jgi:hypothetical protein
MQDIGSSPLTGGTQDGTGASDQDQPYRFGRRPTTEHPYPFSTRQYARLLSLRSRVQAGQFQEDGPEL